MRRIISLLSDYRQAQLTEARKRGVRVPDSKLSEVRDMFGWLDSNLSGIRATTVTDSLQEVMISADFTYALQGFVQRKALPGYKRAQFAFEPLVWPDVLPNYLTVDRLQDRGSLDDLEYVGEKGTPRPGSVDDATRRQYRVYRFEKQYDFSHEALINDDLGYFDSQADKMGQAARRSLEKFVSRMYTNATSIGRLTGLGILYMQNGRMTSARISEARMAFGQRVDARGEPIQADLAYVVYHRGLEDTVRQILNSELVPELATNAVNVVRGAFTPIKDPYIVGVSPNLPWWCFTDWRASNIRPFVLARLQNMPGPIIARKKSDIERVTSLLGGGADVAPVMGDFHTRNILMLVMDVWGTYINVTDGNLFDVAGAYYSAGTAP
jgi:hypothetical protein